MGEGRFGARRESESRAAEARLSALFRTGWIPPEAGEGSIDGGSADSAPVGPPSAVGPFKVGKSDRRAEKGKSFSWRLDPGRGGALAVLVAAGVAAALVGWKVVSDRPQSRPVSVNAQLAAPSGPSGGARPQVASSAGSVATGSATTRTGASATGTGASATGASATDGARVVVDVIGKVVRPGLVRLPPGSRVDDAVRAAGGAVPGTDLSSLNLARVLVDGEQIAVGVEGAVGAPVPGTGTGTGTGTGSGSALVNLNTATVAQLDAGLPGVGPVLAQRIVDWRTTHGRFDSVEQLNQVSGVGDSTFANLRPLVTV